jgi:PAS domain S-box-containing protein
MSEAEEEMAEKDGRWHWRTLDPVVDDSRLDNDDQSDLGRQFTRLSRRFAELSDRVERAGADDVAASDASDPAHGDLVHDLLEELSAAVEELELSTEEIQAQNDALSAVEEQLDAEIRRYRDLFELAPDAYLVTDSRGVILECNRAASGQLNAPARFLQGKPFIVFVDQRDRRRVLTRLNQVAYPAGEEEIHDFEVRVTPFNEKTFWASIRLGASTAPRTRERAVRWILHDITWRVEAEAALRQGEQRYRLLADSSSDLVLTADLEGTITYASPSAGAVLGLPLAILAGTTIADLVVPGDYGGLQEQCDRVAAGEIGQPVVLHMLRAGQDPVLMEAAITAIADDDDNIFSVRLAMRDIAGREEHRVALQRALSRERRAAAAWRDADAAKEALLLAASHDLASPAAAVAGLAEQLIHHADMPEGELSRMAQGVLSAGRQLQDILSNLLDAERVMGGHVVVRGEIVDLHEIAVDELQHRDLPVSCLTPRRGPVLAEIDPGLSRRILANLLDNAVGHTPSGTPVRVGLALDGADVVLTVSDAGPGVPDDIKGTLFEPFTRNGSRAGGLGLGLFIVRRFAEIQGGRAWVANTEGGGATFFVSLPATLVE